MYLLFQQNHNLHQKDIIWKLQIHIGRHAIFKARLVRNAVKIYLWANSGRCNSNIFPSKYSMTSDMYPLFKYNHNLHQKDIIWKLQIHIGRPSIFKARLVCNAVKISLEANSGVCGSNIFRSKYSRTSDMYPLFQQNHNLYQKDIIWNFQIHIARHSIFKARLVQRCENLSTC